MMDMLLTLTLILVKLLLIFGVVLTLAAYLVLAERKILGRLQLRHGPNRVGPFGLLQPLADVIKLLTKEDTIPAGADRPIFLLAPGLTAITALLAFAVVPFSPPITLFGRSIRGLAQLISYELSMGLAIVPVVLAARSFSLTDIVMAQAKLPFAVLHPLAFLIFFISTLAESKRVPFDLPEAEAELVAGFHTEYSGMRFGLFFVGEYINLIILSAMITVLFLGGWHGPLLPPLVWFVGKVLFVCFIFIWIRGSLPRLRYDQLMHFGWKVLVPLALLNVLVTGAVLLWLGV